MKNNLPKRHKKTSFYICIALGAVMLFSFISILATKSGGGGSGVSTFLMAVGFFAAAFLLKRRNDREAREYARAVKQQRRAEQAAKEKSLTAREERAARQREWERAHGRISTKIKGVTFKNEDGSSRQHILKEAMAEECCGGISLEQFEENGEEGIAVYYDGDCVGFVPRDRVAEISAVMSRISAGHLTVERFRPEDEDDEDRGIGGYIYRADLDLVYLKDAT